ncbi:acyl-CoA dehydrogenase family protein [Paenibacillus naphthalenovorans]|uniref:acyl-CoA dehydrogenase family protein n=1 Tax=Paenibacillus naphthalenovorans TaxID=162209 RepID=UPI003D2A7267
MVGQQPMVWKDLLDTAKDLAEVIRNHMDQEADKERVLLKVWPQLIQAGFHRMLVDSRFGGLGLDLRSYLQVIRQLAYGDGALTLAVHVHNVAVYMVYELGKKTFRSRLKTWLDDASLFALARSEDGRDYRYDFSTRISQNHASMILNGQKDFCTLAGLADYYVVFAQPEWSQPSMDSLQLCLVNGKHPAVEVIKSNGLDAMVASSTYSVRFKSYPLSPAELVGQPGAITGLTHPDILPLGICAINIGMADLGIELFIEKERQRCVKPNEDMEIVRWLGQIDVLSHSAQLLLDKSIDSRPISEGNSGVWLRRAKAASDTLIQDVTEGAIRHLGMDGIKSPNPFMYLRNNSYATRILPPNTRKCLLTLGSELIQ